MTTFVKENEYKIDQEVNRLIRELEDTRCENISVEQLINEQDFTKYLRLLKYFSKRYTVFIASADTPCGSGFTKDIASLLLACGTTINLTGKFRHSYAAIINSGELIFEKLPCSLTELVEHECTINTIHVKVISAGFNVPNANMAHIFIGNKNYSPSRRGLNFVVYDMVANHLIDAVNFDTYSESFMCRRPSDIVKKLNKYKNQHPEVTVMSFNLPGFPDSDLSENEKFILQNAVGRKTILNNINLHVFALNQYFTEAEDITEVLTPPSSYLDINGIRRFEDVSGKYVNTAGGHRITTDQPGKYKRTIYIVGGCRVFGVGSSDKGTIASYLQRLLNKYAAEQEFIVQNYGFYLAEINTQTGEELSILNSLPVKQGDIVLCNFGPIDDRLYKEMQDAVKKRHNYGEIFFDNMHCTEAGNHLVSDVLFRRLKQDGFFADKPFYFQNNAHQRLYAEPNGLKLSVEAEQQLEEYKSILKEFYDSMFGIVIGSVVMNCNPFTLGHRYLIEKAAKQVDHLIIFVVQEDKSIFSFEDRLALVDQGVADLKNVTVIPSGGFIISTLTFNDYFNKSKLQERVVDSSLDVTLFAQEIAPCLNIRVRFAGEEPYDKVTKQYNDTLRTILPQYGIQFIEIPRKEWYGEPISASRVRQLLKEKNYEKIAEIVPETTLMYLKEGEKQDDKIL